ncbi:hypothetical protein M885DRAFT_610711 [Pelagophyceae sp. CCMP2097]|nr:hypothetical protein M885DRAFT_610711 [Pelagophyceae sp. CCMP2097]
MRGPLGAWPVLLLLYGTSGLIELPLFPLSKFPRLPTDVLTLNLFEPRYVSLADRVLQADRVFAAVYCGDTAKVLPRGRGSPTALVNVGACGVLCEVRSVEWITREDDDLRRVRLICGVFARFRVASILSSPIRRADALPYIVVGCEPFEVSESTLEESSAPRIGSAFDLGLLDDARFDLSHLTQQGLGPFALPQSQLDAFRDLSGLTLPPAERQRVLEQDPITSRSLLAPRR